MIRGAYIKQNKNQSRSFIFTLFFILNLQTNAPPAYSLVNRAVKQLGCVSHFFLFVLFFLGCAEINSVAVKFAKLKHKSFSEALLANRHVDGPAFEALQAR